MKKHHSKTLGLKFMLMGGMTLLLGLVLCCCVYGIIGSFRMIGDSKKIVNVTFPALDKANILNDLVVKTKRDIQLAFEEQDESLLEVINEYEESFSKVVKEINEKEEDLELLDIQKRYQIYAENAKVAVRKYIDGEDYQFLSKELIRIVKVTGELSDSIKVYKKNKFDDFMFSQEDVLRTSTNFSSVFMFLSAFLILIVLTLMTLIKRMITSLSQLVETASVLDGGNMAVPVLIDRKDEIGTLQSTFETMRISVQSHIENLDKKVEARTREIHLLQRQTQNLLNAIDQGIFTINKDLTINHEHSLQTEVLFKFYELEESTIQDLFELDDETLSQFKEWVEVLFVSKATLLSWKRFVRLSPVHELELGEGKNRRIVKIEYEPIIENNQLVKIMILASDITKQRESEIALEESKKKQNIFSECVMALLMNTRDETIAILDGLDSILKRYIFVSFAHQENTAFLRDIHTLKGNCGTLGFGHISKILDAVEVDIASYKSDKSSSEDLIWKQGFVKLGEAVEEIKNIERMVFSNHLDRIDVSQTRYKELIYQIETQAIQNIDELKSKLIWLTAEPFGLCCDKYRVLVRELSKTLDIRIEELVINNSEFLIQKDTMNIFHQILSHLLRNAVDHGFADNGRKNTENIISLSLEKTGQNIHLIVKDNGIGINPDTVKEKALLKEKYTQSELDSMDKQEIIQLIFEPSFSSRDTTTEISGRGIGLDAVKQIMENFGGSVELSNELGEGSSFICTLKIDENGFVCK